MLALYHMLEDLAYLADAVVDAHDQLTHRAEGLGKDPLAKKATALAAKLEELHQTLAATREGRLTGEEKLHDQLTRLHGAVNDYEGRPTGSQLSYQKVLAQQLRRGASWSLSAARSWSRSTPGSRATSSSP